MCHAACAANELFDNGWKYAKWRLWMLNYNATLLPLGRFTGKWN
jgi:hypothetical protein